MAPWAAEDRCHGHEESGTGGLQGLKRLQGPSWSVRWDLHTGSGDPFWPLLPGNAGDRTVPSLCLILPEANDRGAGVISILQTTRRTKGSEVAVTPFRSCLCGYSQGLSSSHSWAGEQNLHLSGPPGPGEPCSPGCSWSLPDLSTPSTSPPSPSDTPRDAG